MMKRLMVLFAICLLPLSTTALSASGGSEAPPDETVKQAVVDQLVWDNRVDASKIEVEVDLGRVVLSGSVPSDFARRAAIDDVRSVNGVSSVDDNLVIEPVVGEGTGAPLAVAVKGALLVDSQIDASRITVSATYGQVTLGGTVDALWQKYRAEDIASGVRGVAGVNDEIAVVPNADILDQEIAQDILDAINRNANVDVDRVDVRVDDGYVTLTGTVRDRVAREAAYQAAVGTLGVKGVTDELAVETTVKPLYSDSEIAKSVRDQLAWDNQVDATHVAVEATSGQVTLTGTVPSYSAKLAAESDALLIKGVVSVENELTVEPMGPIPDDHFLANRAENILDWSPDVKVQNLSIKVIAGVAELDGEVNALWKKERAGELVRDIQGMVGVINKITVVPTGSILDETISEDIVNAIDRNIHVNVDNVTVTVDNGAVTLSGNVASFTAKEAAFDAALNTAGVRAVVNNLKVSG
jgi:hyperosmotically inducible protein